MELEHVLNFDKYPCVDLHGMESSYASLKVTEFILDNVLMGNKYIVVIHGVGKLILMKMVNDVAKSNKNVISCELFNNNSGASLIKLNIIR